MITKTYIPDHESTVDYLRRTLKRRLSNLLIIPTDYWASMMGKYLMSSCGEPFTIKGESHGYLSIELYDGTTIEIRSITGLDKAHHIAGLQYRYIVIFDILSIAPAAIAYVRSRCTEDLVINNILKFPLKMSENDFSKFCYEIS